MLIVNNTVFFLTKKGKVLRIPIDNIPLMSLTDKNGKQRSRKPKGVKVITLDKDDEVTSIATSQNIGKDVSNSLQKQP